MKQMKERNNSGFTLVELLIAIAILGIIVGPFMHSFVTAARTNAKAQQIQNATVLATNIMEEVKANDMGDLAFQFNYPKRADGTSRFDIVSSYASVYELMMRNNTLQNVTKYLQSGTADNRPYVTSSVLYKDYQTNLDDNYELLGQELGKYYFVMEGLEAGASQYDALITLDSNGYKTVDDKGYNDQHTPVIEALDVLEDAFYVQKANQDEEFAERFVEETGDELEDVLASMARTITIDMEAEGELNRVYVTYTYTYGSNTLTEERLIYTNSESPEYSLKSIYLFFAPNYAATSASSHKDAIIINNLNNIDASVYLIKQRVTSANSIELSLKESNYRAEISLIENVTNFNFSSHKAYASIRTNLGKNLYDSDAIVSNQVLYKYGGSDGRPENRPNVDKVLGVNSLDGSVEKDRIYEVTVAIYKKGEAAKKFTGEPVAKITGSKDN